MASTTISRIRWSDNDRHLGPLIYARDKHYRTLALVLGSGDDEEYPGCRIRFSLVGHTIIVPLPAIIKPWKRKVVVPEWNTNGTAQRLGRDWYWDSHEREYGLNLAEGFLQLFLGRQTMDSSTTQAWSCFLPWTQWRHVRRSLYGLDGEHVWTEPIIQWRLLDSQQNIETRRAIWESEKACSTRTFLFLDFDDEPLSCKTRIEEREWRFGTGWFKWLAFFRNPKVSRSLDLDFSGETGRKKGSWKGGTTGHAIEMLPGELHEAAFQRYCAAHEMTFKGAQAAE